MRRKERSGVGVGAGVGVGVGGGERGMPSIHNLNLPKILYGWPCCCNCSRQSVRLRSFYTTRHYTQFNQLLYNHL